MGVSIKFYLKLLGFKMGHFFTMSRDKVKNVYFNNSNGDMSIT